MTEEQLGRARLAAWRQNGDALLTADDAAAWLRETGLALFDPRPKEVAAPAPSLAEAIAGAGGTPTGEAVEVRERLMRTVTRSGDAAALRLLAGGSLGVEEPDFLASPEVLPFVFALRGDREWGRGPRGRSSPLAVAVWKLLEREGPLGADAIQHALGRQLTASAALRALGELWAELRVEPVYPERGAPAWQLLQSAHEPEMAAGAAMGQALAVSALVSLYLGSAAAATGEDLEAWLAPLASRSRVREAVRAMAATRQLGVVALGAHEYFFIEGSLPSLPGLDTPARFAIPDLLPEVPAPADVVVAGEGGTGFRIEAVPEGEPEPGEGRKRFVARRQAPAERAGFEGRKRKPAEGDERKPFFAREPWKEDRPSRPAARFAPRDPAAAPDRGAAKRTAFGGDRKPFGAGDRKPFGTSGDRKPFGAGDRKPFGTGGDRKPFGTGDRKSFGGGSPAKGERPFRKAFGAADTEGRPPRPDGGTNRAPRPGFARREGGVFPRPASGGPAEAARPGFGPRGNEEPRPFKTRPGTAQTSSSGARSPRPGSPRPGSPRPGSPQGGDTRKPFGAPGGGQSRDRGPWQKRDGAADRPPRSFRPKEGGRGGEQGSLPPRPFSSRPARPSPAGKQEREPFGEGGARPFRRNPNAEGGAAPPRRTGAPDAARFVPGRSEARPGAAARPGGKRPRTAPFTSTGKPRPGVGKPGRPGPKASRPGFGAGASKPGGAKRPGGKGPKRDGGRRDGRDG